MPTKKTSPTRAANPLPLVRPGERALLFSHREYRAAREEGLDLSNYDVLMRQPDDADPSDSTVPEEARWQPAPANKYLKFRAGGWREASSLEDLPEEWQAQIAGRDVFASGQSDESDESGESDESDESAKGGQS